MKHYPNDNNRDKTNEGTLTKSKRKAKKVNPGNQRISLLPWLLLLMRTSLQIKLTQITDTSKIIECGTGSGVIIGAWIQKISDSIEIHVDTGTRTGDSLNLMAIDNPLFTTSNTHMLPKTWTYIAMRYDSSCAAARFFRTNNNDLVAIGSGSSIKFSKAVGIDQTVTNSFNLQSGTSKIDPALRLTSLQYGPTNVLEFEADTASNFDEIAFELALGPAYVSTLDRLWLYKQNIDFEDETVWKGRIFNSTDEFTYFENGNFNSYGALIKPLEVFRYKYIAPNYHHPSYFQNLNQTNFPDNLINSVQPQPATTTVTDPTTGVTTTTLSTNAAFSSQFFPTNASIRDATTYFKTPLTLTTTPSPATPLYSLISPANEISFSSFRVDIKFRHNYEENTLKLNFSQEGDQRNFINFDLAFDNAANTITFVPTNDFHLDANTAYTDFTSAGLKEYVLSLTFSNFTFNHVTTDVTHGRTGLKITLADALSTTVKSWYTTIEDFNLILSEKYILEIKNIKGTETSVSEVRVSDGGLGYETVKASTDVGTYLTNFNPIFGTNPWAFQCPDNNYLDLTDPNNPVCSITNCKAEFSSCFSADEGSKCSSSGFIDLVGRACSATCTTTDKKKLQIETTNTKECVSCLDQYCDTCPDFYYTCETYKTGTVVKPKYVHFNQTDKTLRIRYDQKLNYSRLAEYAEATWTGYTTPTDYTIVSFNKTGDYDLMIYFNMDSPFNGSLLNIKMTRVINWNFGDPAVFYSILNDTTSVYAGFYNNTGWSGFTQSMGNFMATSSKVLVIGGLLFNHEYMFRLLKLWYFTQFLFFLNTELPLNVQIFIDPFRYSIFSWFPNLFTVPNAKLTSCIHPFKFDMNSYSCSFWYNIGHNINFWVAVFIVKCIVSGISHGWEHTYNWYMMKTKGMNSRLSAEFLWKLFDAMGMELLLHLFLYLKVEYMGDWSSADNIGAVIFTVLMLVSIVWTYVILTLFLLRLKPKQMTQDEAADKAHYVIKEEPKKDPEGKPIEKKDIELKKESTFFNYGKWFFIVKKYKPQCVRRLFPLFNFTKQLLFVTILFWLHDLGLYQSIACMCLLVIYATAMTIVRPFKLKIEYFKHVFFEDPIAIAYGFLFFALQKDLSALRFMQLNTVYYLSGLGCILSLLVVYVYVNFILFFKTFTGIWEWANKITERCRGDVKPFQIQPAKEEPEKRKVEIIEKPPTPPPEAKKPPTEPEEEKKKKKKKKVESDSESSDDSYRRRKKKKKRRRRRSSSSRSRSRSRGRGNSNQPQIIMLGGGGMPQQQAPYPPPSHYGAYPPTTNNDLNPAKAKEAYNDGYLAGLKEAQNLKGESSRPMNNRKRSSNYTDEEDSLTGGYDREEPRYARSYKEPMRRPKFTADNRSAKDKRPRRMKKPRNMTSTPMIRNDPNQADLLDPQTKRGFRQGDVENIERTEPDQIYDISNKGGNNRFFDKSKLKDINNFRTKDGKNFDEQVDLRRQRYVRNKKNNFVDDE